MRPSLLGLGAEIVSASLTVLVPAYNEGEGLREFQRRTLAVLDALPLRTRVL